jgi:hypothetical protein
MAVDEVWRWYGDLGEGDGRWNPCEKEFDDGAVGIGTGALGIGTGRGGVGGMELMELDDKRPKKEEYGPEGGGGLELEFSDRLDRLLAERRSIAENPVGPERFDEDADALEDVDVVLGERRLAGMGGTGGWEVGRPWGLPLVEELRLRRRDDSASAAVLIQYAFSA